MEPLNKKERQNAFWKFLGANLIVALLTGIAVYSFAKNEQAVDGSISGLKDNIVEQQNILERGRTIETLLDQVSEEDRKLETALSENEFDDATELQEKIEGLIKNLKNTIDSLQSSLDEKSELLANNQQLVGLYTELRKNKSTILQVRKSMGEDNKKLSEEIELLEAANQDTGGGGDPCAPQIANIRSTLNSLSSRLNSLKDGADMTNISSANLTGARKEALTRIRNELGTIAGDVRRAYQ